MLKYMEKKKKIENIQQQKNSISGWFHRECNSNMNLTATDS